MRLVTSRLPSSLPRLLMLLSHIAALIATVTASKLQLTPTIAQRKSEDLPKHEVDVR